MAFNTKLSLIEQKFDQPTNGTLKLSGSTYFNKAEYLTGMTPTYNAKTIVDVAFVTGQTADVHADIMYLSGQTSGNTADINWISGVTTYISGVTTQNVADIQYISGITVNNYDAFTGYTASTSATIANAITGVTNGLTKVGSHSAKLGGALTAPTIFTGSSTNHLKYNGDYSAGFGLQSIPDWQSIVTVKSTGKTANFTLSLVELGEAVIVTSATEVLVTIPNDSSVNFPVGSIVIIQQGGDGIVTASGDTGVTVTGVSLSTTRKYSFVQYWKTAANTWTVIGGGIELWETSGSTILKPIDESYKVPIQYISGLQAALDGTLTGATNGLTKCGQDVWLGGALCCDTSICGANKDLCLGTTASKLDCLCVAAGTTCIAAGITNITTGSLSVTSSGATFTDVCATKKGIEYAADYSASFVDNSLITKCYVDTCICSETSGVTTNAICLATNGLTKVGNDTVKLGGTLTGSTVINDTRGTPVGIEYGGNYDATLTCLSLVDAQYVTGKTSCLQGEIDWVSGQTVTKCAMNTYSGTTAPAQFVSKLVGDIGQIIYSCGTDLTGCSYMYFCPSTPSVSFGRDNEAIGGDSGVFAGACNTAGSDCSVTIGGYQNFIDLGADRAVIIGGQNIDISGATYIDTTVVDCLAIMNGIGCTSNLLCVNTTTGKVGYTSISEFGGLTGATNGLHICGQDVLLGGVLSADTSICGGGLFDLCLGKSTSKLDYLWVNANCACIVTGDLGISSSGATFTDLKPAVPASGRTGILYAADYSLGFLPRSLVDKGYVDSIATGLNVHTAVKVATTGAIVLANGQTIDGIVVSNPDRVLVKNQGVGVTGSTANGIYVVVDAGAWTRATDYDFSPSGEVSNGDLIPVITGDTQNNTLWALTSLNPIVSGTTPLIFSLFGSVIDVQAGAGIAISQVGGVHTVCVNLGTNSGLNTASGLVIGAGCGLSTSGGVLNINAADTLCSAIPVLDNAGNCLVVACADILGVMAGAATLTGATNGLCATSGVVCLGGLLTEANTNVNGNSTNCLSLTCLKEFNLGFCCGVVTDTCGTKKGLQYAADYSASFVENSLVSAKYVTGLTSCAIITACNGLTKNVNGSVVLGGDLTGNTKIDVKCHTFQVVGAPAAPFIAIDDTTQAASTISIGSKGCTSICGCSSAGVEIIAGGNFNLTFGGSAIITDNGGTKSGLTYATQYCYVDLSLITKCYVDSCIAEFSGITTCAITDACNGLHVAGQSVGLGGTLTGDTTVDGVSGTWDLSLTDLDAFALGFNSTGIITDNVGAGLQYASVYTPAGPTYLVDAGYVTGITSTKSDCATTITGGTNGLSIDGVNLQNLALGGTLCCALTTIDAVGNNLCITGTHICMSFDNTAADCFYITNHSAGCSELGMSCGCVYLWGDGASGGVALCASNLDLCFSNGGIITDSRAGAAANGICYAASYCYIDLSLITKCYADTCICAATSGITGNYFCAADNGLHKSGNNTVSLGGDLTGNTTIGAGVWDLNINVVNFNLTGSTIVKLNSATEIVLSGSTVKIGEPTAGVTSDAVLVWDSADSTIKTVAGSSLGDKNNIYAKTIQTGDVTLVSGDTYVQLISPSASTTITLPLNPIDGQAFKIKDVSGGALINNITIDGNGKNIDGSPAGTINTDFGALELVYDLSLDAWFSLAFIN